MQKDLVDAFVARNIRVSTRLTDTLHAARDLWPQQHLGVRSGSLATEDRPAAVLFPKTKEDVVFIVQQARAHRTAIVPYGAGSGVCGGIQAKDGWVVDLKSMNRIVKVDTEARTLDAEPGVMGLPLEAALGEQGMTLGHFPSSIVCSSVGGWIAARGAGQCSSRYGKIEDMVLELECVLGTGEVVSLRQAQGGLAPIMVGSEGTLGIITEAKLALALAPQERSFSSFNFKTTQAGMDGLRVLMQGGFRPAVARLYDPFDAMLARRGKVSADHKDHATKKKPEHALLPGLKPAWARKLFASPNWLNRGIDRFEHLLGGALLTLIFEDDEAGSNVALREASAARKLLESVGATYEGERAARTWLSHRYSVSYRQAPVFATGLFSDTFEIAATWEKLPGAYEAVRKALGETCFVMAHMSHAYPDGCCIYFSFVGGGQGADWERTSLQRYKEAWQRALAAAERSGATVAHHHGVGRSKAEAFKKEVGAGGIELYWAAKAACDPDGILNPGCFGLDKPMGAPSREAQAAKTGAQASNVSIDKTSHLARVGESASEAQVREAAAEHGLSVRFADLNDTSAPADPAAGLIAGIEAHLPSGTPIVIRPCPRRSAGPDWMPLLTDYPASGIKVQTQWLCLEQTAARTSPRLPNVPHAAKSPDDKMLAERIFLALR
jgi:alkyldihydroxyacetonephosphate synthase